MKFYHDKKKAVSVTVRLSDELDKYARDFLHIFNNVREYDWLYEVRNYPCSNDVTVTGAFEDTQPIRNYLAQFGEVVRVETVLLIDTQVEFDYDEYENYDDVVLISNEV